jgi:hypothetical protein
MQNATENRAAPLVFEQNIHSNLKRASFSRNRE